jgi:hypothetical protein
MVYKYRVCVVYYEWKINKTERYEKYENTR